MDVGHENTQINTQTSLALAFTKKTEQSIQEPKQNTESTNKLHYLSQFHSPSKDPHYITKYVQLYNISRRSAFLHTCWSIMDIPTCSTNKLGTVRLIQNVENTQNANSIQNSILNFGIKMVPQYVI